MLDQIKRLTDRYHGDTVAIRRELHQHPELSFQEKRTGKFIATKLAKYGIAHEHGWADNGVVGIIAGKNPKSRTIALRADIDALPITEANDVPYKSKNEGVMHACGHDAHTASLLGAARILQELKDEFSGTIKLIFQPAEEMHPGGASLLIKAGVLENPRPASILGQHVHPPLAAGKVGMRPGMYMASADEIYVTVSGRGGHGALPQDCIDPIVITSYLITALQQIVSRRATPTTPSVLTFGKINSTGGNTNVIPDEVKLMGTFRTMDEQWRAEAHRLMRNLAEGLCASMGGSCDFQIRVGYPFLINEPQLTARTFERASAYLGAANVEELPIRMTAEDFAYYSHELPGCFYRLGTGNAAKGITAPVHTTTFNIDEDALRVGVGLMAYLATEELKSVQ